MGLQTSYPSSCHTEISCPVCMDCPVVTGSIPIASVTLTAGQSYFDNLTQKWYFFDGAATKELFAQPANATFTNLTVTGQLILAPSILTGLATALCAPLATCINSQVTAAMANYAPTAAQLNAVLAAGTGISLTINATTGKLVVTNALPENGLGGTGGTGGSATMPTFNSGLFINTGTAAAPNYTINMTALCAALSAAGCNSLGSGAVPPGNGGTGVNTGGGFGTGNATVSLPQIQWSCTTSFGTPINNAPPEYQVTVAASPNTQTLTLQVANGAAWVNSTQPISPGINVLNLASGAVYRILTNLGAFSSPVEVTQQPSPCPPDGA